jgi:hypothetical protein
VTDDKSIESMLFPPDSEPYGLKYALWTIKWWKWILSIPKEKNPVLDKSGLFLAEGQSDPNVWFLAGTFGGSVVRKCRIPLGKAILMPIINYECSFADEPSIKNVTALELKCKSEIDDIKNLSFTIDQLNFGDMTPYRIHSPVFDVSLGPNNILDAGELHTKMITGGYWVLIKPLRAGSHHLMTSGSCQSGKIMIGTTYELYVE